MLRNRSSPFNRHPYLSVPRSIALILFLPESKAFDRKKSRKKRVTDLHLQPSSSESSGLRAISSFHAVSRVMENSLDRGGGRLPRMQTDYQSLSSAKPRAPVNTEIMQRDNSPLHPNIVRQCASRFASSTKRRRNTKRRRVAAESDDDDDVRVDGEERRTNGNGRDLGTRREREQLEGEGNNVHASSTLVYLIDHYDYSPKQTVNSPLQIPRVRDQHLHKQCILIS